MRLNTIVPIEKQLQTTLRRTVYETQYPHIASIKWVDAISIFPNRSPEQKKSSIGGFMDAMQMRAPRRMTKRCRHDVFRQHNRQFRCCQTIF
ncbi:hypothetical protein CEXT_770241 [Caerostris extrusa]|uniref:Uncharacterized protein n=1 Tax=Caerostris extrusa TaxID=172846 RepID=A0AAV4P779_CAEEX|nr:hypothetical protein CEXT_770241 [Caerostris extrusa]